MEREELPRKLLRQVAETGTRVGSSVASGLLDDPEGANLRIMGRTLLHATLIGVVAGLLCQVFSLGVDWVQDLVLRRLAGYDPLLAAGEHVPTRPAAVFRPWLLAFLPALGGLGAGYVLWRLAPELLGGGGGNGTIETFHRRDAIVRRRVPFVRLLASVATLGFGGSGGREGPTMQIASGVSSIVARFLAVPRRERRILYVAGIAAGVSAVFRTPLGAALFAVEVLYRDDFETDALIPAVLASVVAYSTAMPFAPASKLFAHAPSYPFVPSHLPWHVLLAIACAGVGVLFLRTTRAVHGLAARTQVPPWVRPALGGAVLGAGLVPVLYLVGDALGRSGSGLGLMGSSYGGAQLAITGASWLPGGWTGAGLLAGLCLLKILATAVTLGSGGSAGDFAPSLVIGALTGGAFGRAVGLVTGDASIDPGAFALVGMGALFGGIANVPLSSLVLVCELAGSYDLVVPLMLAEGVAFVLLRHRTLYPAQLLARSPAFDRLAPAHGLSVADVLLSATDALTFTPATPLARMLERMPDAPLQLVYPILDAERRLVGLVTATELHAVADDEAPAPWMVAADLQQKAVVLHREDPLAAALAALSHTRLPQLPVVDADGQLAGFFDERVALARLAPVTEPPPARL